MRRWGTLLVLLVAVLGTVTSANAAPHDTTVRTIQDTNSDNLLEFAPGEDHCVFSLGLQAPTDCAAGELAGSPESILNFLQLSDFQIVDEESPARVEAVDTTQRIPGAQPFSAAHRPQESLTNQITEAMVRQVRNTTSPITGAPLDLAILTGDNADSQQYNETRWFIDVLDGTVGAGNPDPEMDDPDNPSSDRKIVPDSGIHSQVTEVCGEDSGYGDNASPYDGVKGGGGLGPDAGYWDPDGDEDGDGYTPDRERNIAEVGRDVTVRDFPDLFDEAQQPFEAVGIAIPWYSAFGNHDALVQGNSGDAYVGPFGPGPEVFNPSFDAIARGCLKPTKLPTGVSPAEFAANPGAYIEESEPVVVPPDPRRCFVAKDRPNTALAPCDTGGWIQQHNRTTGAPRGHGFEAFRTGDRTSPQTGPGRPASARLNHDGYYSFSPRPGVRFVVLDSITDECGVPVCSEGSVDDTQYRWLENEVTAAEAAGQYVLVFSHHTERTTRMESTDATERPIHYGERVDRKDRTQPPRPVRPDAPPESTLEDLFCRHRNVVANVNGHEHENYVLPHNCEDGPPLQTGRNRFVEASTAAHIDWPQQSRILELLREESGRLALALTIVDHAGPANPGGGQAPDQILRLASIGREVAYNDYQGSRGARGNREDRNVIVETDKPWPPPTSP